VYGFQDSCEQGMSLQTGCQSLVVVSPLQWLAVRV
jgi:hypothetical protein